MDELGVRNLLEEEGFSYIMSSQSYVKITDGIEISYVVGYDGVVVSNITKYFSDKKYIYLSNTDVHENFFRLLLSRTDSLAFLFRRLTEESRNNGIKYRMDIERYSDKEFFMGMVWIVDYNYEVLILSEHGFMLFSTFNSQWGPESIPRICYQYCQYSF